MDMTDLNLVSLNAAKSIIVLSPDDDDPDAGVIKTVLAIVNHPKRRAEPYHIVAEIYDPRNMEAALVAGKDEVEWTLVGDFVARVIAQTCRQSGLSAVYTELLDFGGDEIYFTRQPALVGKNYGETLHSFETNGVMGIVSPGQLPRLNPPMDTILRAEDELILIAEDDDKIQYTPGKTSIQEAAIISEPGSRKLPENTLVLGWNQRAAAIIRELDHYVPEGSKVHVVADVDDLAGQLRDIKRELTNLQVNHQEADTTSRRVLDDLQLADYNHIIVLCYSDTLKPQQADARTIVTLLHLRDIANRSGMKFTIVSEMLDLRNRSLADVTRADDFIVSDKLVSLMLAQVAENKRLNGVFLDMFDPEGSEIYLKPATDYVKPGVPVNFYTVLESARRRGETAIGYRIQSDTDNGNGIKINPNKAETHVFGENDRVVVIAED